MSNALPEGFVVRSKKAWEELLQHTDLAQRGIPNQALRTLGVPPAVYVKMKEPEKLAKLLEHQAAAGYGEDGKLTSGVATTTKAAAKAGTTATTTATTASTKAPATSSSSGGGASDGQLVKQVADLQAQLVEARKEILEISGFIREMHFFQRVIVMSNPDAAALMEDEGVRTDFFGKLAGITGGEETGNG